MGQEVGANNLTEMRAFFWNSGNPPDLCPLTLYTNHLNLESKQETTHNQPPTQVCQLIRDLPTHYYTTNSQ